MKWIELTTQQQLEEIIKQSQESPILIFKHSTRCATSRMTLDRLERNWNAQEMAVITPYYLDLISYREVSNLIANQFGVQHESPQILIISKGRSVLDRSHLEIDYREIKEAVKNQKLLFA